MDSPTFVASYWPLYQIFQLYLCEKIHYIHQPLVGDRGHLLRWCMCGQILNSYDSGKPLHHS